MNSRGAIHNHWWEFHHGWQENQGEVIEEIALTIYVNGQEFISIMGTPLNQDWLAVGFLMNERIISSLDEVVDIRITEDGCCIDVWLTHAVERPSKIFLTSGCGGGMTFDDPSVGVEPFGFDITTTPDVIHKAFNTLQTKESLYARARGVHAAGLIDLDKGELIKVSEDIGRHNTIDKLRGACLLEGIPTINRALITTGRISSEMLRKGALMGCQVIASRTSPTSFALELAKAWNITLIGYARQGKIRVYCYPERLGFKNKTEER
jgi:FdhD protein